MRDDGDDVDGLAEAAACVTQSGVVRFSLGSYRTSVFAPWLCPPCVLLEQSQPIALKTPQALLPEGGEERQRLLVL